MLNVKTQVKGGVLTITVDLKERHGKSASGRGTRIERLHETGIGVLYDMSEV